MNIELVEEEKSLVAQEQEELKILDTKKAAEIMEKYSPQVEAYVEAEPKITALLERVKAEGYTPDICLDAKDLRLEIRKVRTGAEKVKKEEKEVYLKVGKAIQGVYNIIKGAVEKYEDSLLGIEEYFTRIEEAKKAKIAEERKAELDKYEFDYSNVDVLNMDETFWNTFITGVKTAWQAQKDTDAKEEADRIAAQEKQDTYNSRLRALLVYGDLFDQSSLTVDSTEEDFEKILFSVKALKMGKDKQQEEIALENAKLKEAADKAAVAEVIRVNAEKEKADKLAAEEVKEAEAPDIDRLNSIIVYLRQQYAAAQDVKAKNGIVRAAGVISATIKELEE